MGEYIIVINGILRSRLLLIAGIEGFKTHSNLWFDDFEHRKRFPMRTLEFLATLHTCHNFLQRGKHRHHLALKAQ